MKSTDRLVQTGGESSIASFKLSDFLSGIYHAAKRTHPSILWRQAASALVALALTEDVRVLVKRGADELVLLPQVGGEEAVGVGDGREGGLEGVLKGLGATGGGRVGVVDTSELQQTLDGRGGDNAGTAGSGDETDGDGTALARLLDGNGVRLTKVGDPVTTADRYDVKLGDDDSGADGGSDFLGGLDTETDVAVGVTNEDDGLEAGTLTGTGLLLDGLDLHDLVLEGGEEEVDDLVLLDGERVEVDLLHGLDLAGLDETTELGDRLPLLLLVLGTTATTAATTATTATVTT